MDMTDKEILEKWNDEEICEESVEKLNEIKEKYIITEEETEEMLKELKKEMLKELKKIYGGED